MTSPRISYLAHDSLLTSEGADATTIVKRAEAAIDAGAGEIALRFTEQDSASSVVVDLSRAVRQVATRGGATFDLVLATADPAAKLRSIMDAGVRPDRCTVMPETLDFFVDGKLRLGKQTRQAVLDAAQLCAERELVLGLEIFHAGGAWFVEHVGQQIPAVTIHCQLPFNVPGTCWAPPTADTLRYRRSLLPAETPVSVYCFSDAPDSAFRAAGLYAIAIGDGHDARVGQHTWRTAPDGVPFASPAEQVAYLRDLAAASGRDGKAKREPAEASRK